MSNGMQMYCSLDDEFYFPETPEETTTFTDREDFLSTTNSAFFLTTISFPRLDNEVLYVHQLLLIIFHSLTDRQIKMVSV